MSTRGGELRRFLGVARNTTSHGEKLLSALGAGIGIALVSAVGTAMVAFGWLESASSYLLVASMGASAVLLFAVPYGALSQPWAVLGGHGVSAVIGVLSYSLLGDGLSAGACAVGLAVGAMYYLRCIHPPGGATALTAVIGAEALHDLGLTYVLFPVMLNAFVIVAVAILFNAIFPWRRYPSYWGRRHLKTPAAAAQAREFELTREDFSAAIVQTDSFVDLTEEALSDILELAKQHAERNVVHPAAIVAGRFYSNGKLGRNWSVRQVVDAAEDAALPSKDTVIYKVVAGDQAYVTGICLRDEFKRWARFEVVQQDGRWLKAA